MQQKQDRFKSNVAILVALVTIFGAMAACLASVAASAASDADFEGVAAAINAQRSDIVNKINAYEHSRAYTSYIRYLELGSLLYAEGVSAGTDSAEARWMEYWGLADAMKILFFPPRYLDLERGGYNLQRELEEAQAEDAQFNDLNPQPHFERSDLLRWKSLLLTADLIVFALSFWFLMTAQIIENRLKYVLAALGVLTILGALLVVLFAEVLL